MTKSEAIRIARKRVSIVPQGRDYVMHTWSPKHNATWVSHSMDYWQVRHAAREAMLREALLALEIDDAEATAYVLAQEEGRWTDLIAKAA